MRFKNQIFLLGLLTITLSGCTPTLPVTIDEEINYSQEINLTWNEYDKLSYLLEWVINMENDSADSWNKPLSTDAQKWTFIFNILNNNYMDKYENPEEVSENPRYPILEDSFIANDWDIHDW
jgi:Na+-transporting NADH:ubiquinone oxidoreductase subunit NqrF